MSEGSASKLSELLEASRPELQAAVADARRELRELDERRQELVSLITRAQAALGEDGAAYERQVENLQNVKKGIADIVTAKKRLALRQQQLGEQGAEFDAQAREAMSAGREDLARAALERKQLAVQEAGSLDQQIAQLESEQGKLIESEKQLRAKIEQFRSKKDVINAQYFEGLTALGPARTTSIASSTSSARRAPSTTSSPASRRRSSRALRTPRSLPTTPARLTTRTHSSPLMPTARLLPPVSSPDPLIAGFARCDQRV